MSTMLTQRVGRWLVRPRTLLDLVRMHIYTEVYDTDTGLGLLRR